MHLLCMCICLCVWVYACEYWPSRTGQEQASEEAGWRSNKSFHLLIGSPGQQFPSCSACGLTSRAVPPRSFPCPSSWPCIWEAPTAFLQPGPSRVHLWLHLQWLLWLRGFTKASRSSLPAILTLRACMKLPERCVGSQRKHCQQLTPVLGGVCAQKIIRKKW